MIWGILYGAVGQEQKIFSYEGGLACYQSMGRSFKFLVNLFCVVGNLFVIFKPKKTNEENTELKQRKKWVEIIYASLGVIILIAIVIVKIKTRTLLFILNPCHV